MRYVAVLALVGCVGPPPSSLTDSGVTSPSTTSSSVFQCPTMTAPVTDRSCPDGGLPTDVDLVLTPYDADEVECPGQVCPEGPVVVGVEAVNHCAVDVELDHSCTGLSWSLSDGTLTESVSVTCATGAISTLPLPPEGRADLGSLPFDALEPGAYALTVRSASAASPVTLAFCVE
jgi:hypothetical protein